MRVGVRVAVLVVLVEVTKMERTRHVYDQRKKENRRLEATTSDEKARLRT